MYLNIRLVILFAVLTTFLSSCATVFTGTHDTVYINSKPEGAKIIIDGVNYGKTPRDLRIKRTINSSYVRLVKEEYATSHFELRKEFNLVTIANVIFPWFFAVDAATGAMFIYSPNYYEIELTPEK